ncbi:ABC transporter permease [Cryptosporangium minutisporangium]|uniref:ABC transporter permease n=1 Tax=Cryptosporangium minutisporangium TaxID=113569 RepID=A0ABP6SVV7_9ACTN
MTTVAESPSYLTQQSAKPTAPSMGRLTGVELRKMADTRAGRWLLASVGLIVIALVTVRVFAGPSDTRTLENFLTFATGGVSILLPVLGILAVTSEWNQRTALTTFALVPRRHRVLTAKLLAAVVITVLSVVASLGVAVLGNLAADLLNRGGSWDLSVGAVFNALLFQLVNMLMGVAFGALLLASGLAIVLYFVIPTVWSILGSTVTALKDVAGWLDLGTTTEPLLTASMHGDDWTRLAVSVAFWVLLPLVGGVLRVLHHEVK